MQGDPPSGGGESEERGKWLPPEPAGNRSDIGRQSPAGQSPPAGPEPPGKSDSPAAPQSPVAPQGTPPGASPPPPYASHPPGYAPPPYAQQGDGAPGSRPGQPEPGNGPAVAALVLGIVSLALLLVTFGASSIVSLACAVPAIFLGRKGRRLVDDGQTRKHRGLAQAGFIMGIVGTVLSVLATTFWVLIVLSDEFQESFEEELDNQNFDQSAAGVLAVRVAVPLARLLLG